MNFLTLLTCWICSTTGCMGDPSGFTGCTQYVRDIIRCYPTGSRCYLAGDEPVDNIGTPTKRRTGTLSADVVDKSFTTVTVWRSQMPGAKVIPLPVPNLPLAEQTQIVEDEFGHVDYDFGASMFGIDSELPLDAYKLSVLRGDDVSYVTIGDERFKLTADEALLFSKDDIAVLVRVYPLIWAEDITDALLRHPQTWGKLKIRYR